MRNLKFKKISFVLIFLTIGILVFSSFRGVTLAAPAQDNSHGTFYDNFSDSSAVSLNSYSELNANQTRLELKEDWANIINSATIDIFSPHKDVVSLYIKNNFLYAVSSCVPDWKNFIILNLAYPFQPQQWAGHDHVGIQYYDIFVIDNYAYISARNKFVISMYP